MHYRAILNTAIWKFSDVRETLTAKHKDGLISFLTLNVLETKIFHCVFLEENNHYWSSTQRNVVEIMATKPEFFCQRWNVSCIGDRHLWIWCIGRSSMPLNNVSNQIFWMDSNFKGGSQNVWAKCSDMMSNHNVKLAGYIQNLVRQCPMTDCYFQHWIIMWTEHKVFMWRHDWSSQLYTT